MDLGNFSVSLAVKDIAMSRAFYEKLGFAILGGDESQGWLIMKSPSCVIGLFQGMFEKNTLTFNPGWDAEGGRSMGSPMSGRFSRGSKRPASRLPAKRMSRRPARPVASSSTPTATRSSSTSMCDTATESRKRPAPGSNGARYGPAPRVSSLCSSSVPAQLPFPVPPQPHGPVDSPVDGPAAPAICRRRATRFAVLGWVENRLSTLCACSGLMMNMCAVAGFCVRRAD